MSRNSALRIRDESRHSHLAWAALLLIACAGDQQPGANSQDVVVRDSAGVRIVELPAIPHASTSDAWSIAQAPALEIGLVEGPTPYQFSEIVGIAALSDGRIAVLEGRGGSSELRFFGADGEHLRTAGGAGEGPGEFTSPQELVRLPGDTLVVRDGAVGVPARVVFTGQGEFLRRVQAPHDLLPLGSSEEPPEESVESGTLLRDGTLLIRTFFPAFELDPTPGESREPFRLLRVHGDDSDVTMDTIGGRFLAGEYYTADVGQGTHPYRVPFGAVEIHTSGPDRIYVADSRSGEVAAYGYGGELHQVLRPRLSGRSLTEADYNRGKQAIIDYDPLYDNSAITERLFQRLPRRSTSPALAGLTVDLDGNLWLEKYRPGEEDDGREWIVLGPKGEFHGIVTAPERFAPFEIGGDYLLGVRLDELDIPYVRRYDLTK